MSKSVFYYTPLPKDDKPIEEALQEKINILKKLDPDAFVIKSEVTPQELLKAVKKVQQEHVHYSQSITIIMRKQLTQTFL